MKKKRGYSRAFTPRKATGKRYLLGNIPAGLWTAVRTKCTREEVSVRAAILGLLQTWVHPSSANPDVLIALRALARHVDRELSGFWTERTSNLMQQAEAAMKAAAERKD